MKQQVAGLHVLSPDPGCGNVRRRAARFLGPLPALAGLVACSVACSLAVRADRQQCSTDDDCANRVAETSGACVANVCVASAKPPVTPEIDAGPADPIWGCLGKVKVPPREETVLVHYLVGFADLVSNNPFVGLSVKVCPQGNDSCTQPLGDAAYATDDQGIVDLPLYSGFHGFLDVQPGAETKIVPSVYYVMPTPDKLVGPIEPMPRAPLLTSGTFTLLTAVVGREPKPEHGHLFYGVLDCRGQLAPGSIVSVDQITVDTFAFDIDSSGTPAPTQARGSVSGKGGYVNLPAGVVDVARRTADGRAIDTLPVTIRPGSITYLVGGPTR